MYETDPNEPEARRPGGLALSGDLRYVAIEGVIGAGKTTLTRLLAARCNGRAVLEEFDQNPFLSKFYAEPGRWAFHTQLSFLASRFQQQKTLLARDLFQQVVVCDYTFDKDRIFAHLNLQGDELQLYKTLFNLMEPVTPTPDLVVYLQTTPERLMENIKRRDRPYERNMDVTYIEALNEAYNYYFFRYTKSPLLIVNAARIDFVNNQQDLEELLRQIIGGRYHGMTYFNPPPSNQQTS